MNHVLIGLAGLIGSGKDTVADILVRDHGFVKISFADKMKRIAKDAYDFTDEQLWGPSSARNAPDKRYPRQHTVTMLGSCNCCSIGCDADDASVPQCYLTPRYALQLLGTQWGRHCYSNTWVDYALRMAHRIFTEEPDWGYPGYTAQHGFNTGSMNPARGVVISDVRFENEVAAIRAAGGTLWKTIHGTGLSGAAGAHESEQHISHLEVDAVVPDGALEELPQIVTTMLRGSMR